jgi:hypothetical protein
MKITVDHARAVRDAKYFVQVARELAETPKGAVTTLTFAHDADDSCCLEERYQLTLIRLLEASPYDVIEPFQLPAVD